MPIKLKKTVSTSAVTGNSVQFNGTNQYLSIANNAAFDFGAGDFTIELWFMLTADASLNNGGTRDATFIAAFEQSGALITDWAFGVGGDATTTGTNLSFGARQSSTQQILVYTNTITKNVWHHTALTRTGNTISLYYDGVRAGQNTSFTNASNTGGNAISIGALLYAGYLHYFPGYISNVRVVKGSVVYTGTTYAVPTAPLTAITNTSLLTCQSPTIIDNSTNNFTITNNNTATVSSAVVPFTTSRSVFKLKKNNANPTGPTNYSVLFDGSTQYLKLPSNSSAWTLNGDFTIECWFNTTTTNQNGIFTMNWSGDWNAVYGNGFSLSSNVVVTPQGNTTWTSPSINVWHHIAVVRSGATIITYLDGVNVGSQTNSNQFGNASTTPGVGLFDTQSGIRCPFPGYISNLRILKGTALYTAAFTPSTSPLTSITNTQLLTCNAATIVDSSNNNFTITNNNTATVSSTITPFTASISTNKFKLRQVSYSPYMIATGGDLITTSGSYKIHTFTTVGTSSFVVSNIGNNLSVECLIVGGGGGGGGRAMAGGGGGGGVVYTSSAFLAIGSFSAIVGAGGIAATGMQASSGQNGGSTSFTYNGITTTALGGGGGATEGYVGLNGANGGGGTNGNGAGGAGVGGGFPGGSGSAENYLTRGCGGGGGGAGGAGVRGVQAIGGNGGVGAIYNITGSAYYGGGGGGGGNTNAGGATAGAGGLGGGGLGGRTSPGTAGTSNTGGGGGGGGYTNTTGASETNGGNGGSGIILIKYRYTD